MNIIGSNIWLQAQPVMAAIRRSYQLLSSAQDLSPDNGEITATLTNLVRTLTRCQAPELTRFLLQTPDLQVERENLPYLCGQAECEMEKYWARTLISRPNCDLAEFWYFPEYSALCRAEIDLFKKRTFGHISFLGAGALPMTAFLLAQHCPETQIACVDFDADACDLAEKLSHKIGLKDRVTVSCMDALHHVPQHGELVICASLLQGRERIYSTLEQHECAALIVRDSEGPYQYLYRPAELPQGGFREVRRTKIDSRRINTSRYFEKNATVLRHAA